MLPIVAFFIHVVQYFRARVALSSIQKENIIKPRPRGWFRGARLVDRVICSYTQD